MPQAINMDAGHPGRFQRLAPLTGEVASPQLGTVGAGEDELVVGCAGELLQVLSDIGQQERRDADPADARGGLGRPGDKRPIRQLDHSGLDADEARRHVDVLTAERGQLAPAQATENCKQDEQPVAAISERVG
jgi:hypothetical protein